MLAAEVLWLKQLLDEGQWDKVLKVSEQLVRRGGYAAVDYAEINYAICRARAFRQETQRAIPAGELAKRLCLDTQQWDLLGKVVLVLGVSYNRMRSYDRSLATLYEYFGYMNQYETAQSLVGRVWHNIGHNLFGTGRVREAADAFRRAREGYRQTGDEHWYFYATHELVECLLSTDLSAVPALLAELRSFLHTHPTILDCRPSYYLRRARHALHVKAHWWAASLCLSGLAGPPVHAEVKFKLHLTLSEALAALGDYKDALGHALAARMEAIRCSYFNLEFLAVEAMYDLMSKQGESVIQALDEDYLQQGLDMVPFVGGTVLPERRYS